MSKLDKPTNEYLATDWDICALQTAMRNALRDYPNMLHRDHATALLAKLENARAISIWQYPERVDIFGMAKRTT